MKKGSLLQTVGWKSGIFVRGNVRKNVTNNEVCAEAGTGKERTRFQKRARLIRGRRSNNQNAEFMLWEENEEGIC